MNSDDATNVAKDSLELVIKVFEVMPGVSAVSEILNISGNLVSAFPVVGALLMLIGNFLSNSQHEEIMSGLNHLSNQIDRVRDDIWKLGNELGWQMTEHHYGVVVDRIELGIRYVADIGRATGQVEKDIAKHRLKSLFVNRDYVLALDNLLEGITGTGLLKGSSILDKYDLAVAKCYRKKISALATPLLKVASGGILVISTYEAMMHGEKEAKKLIKDHKYISQLEDACRKAQSVLDRCVEKFRENMLVDLNSFLDKGGSNQNLVNEIRDFLSEKYDWLENFVLVYDDVHGWDNHCIGGHYVHSFHHNDKCGVVFYRTKDESHETPGFSYKYDEAYKIVKEIRTENAKEGYNNIKAKMEEKSIGIIGMAVINTRVASWWSISYMYIDIRWGGTFSTKTITAHGRSLKDIYVREHYAGTISQYGPTKIVLLQ